MFVSFLAALFFALNATCASHSVRAVGPLRANLGRLLIATVLLALFAHTLGHGFRSASTGWFFLGGVIGVGLGDLGVYAALPLLGSRLTVLMTQCLAAPIAAFGEWWWLGTRLSALQLIWGSVILLGVAVAIIPGRSRPPRVQVRPMGFLFGLVAAGGQGFGALASRKGGLVAVAAGESVGNFTFGFNAAYHRILAGLVFVAGWFLVRHLLSRSPGSAPARPADAAGRHRRYLWMLANGLAGPVAAGRLLPMGARHHPERHRAADRRDYSAALDPGQFLAGGRPAHAPLAARRRHRGRRLRRPHAGPVSAGAQFYLSSEKPPARPGKSPGQPFT